MHIRCQFPKTCTSGNPVTLKPSQGRLSRVLYQIRDTGVCRMRYSGCQRSHCTIADGIDLTPCAHHRWLGATEEDGIPWLECGIWTPRHSTHWPAPPDARGHRRRCGLLSLTTSLQEVLRCPDACAARRRAADRTPIPPDPEIRSTRRQPRHTQASSSARTSHSESDRCRR